MRPATRPRVLGDLNASRAASPAQAAGGRWGPRAPASTGTAADRPKVLSKTDQANLTKGFVETPAGRLKLRQHALPAPGKPCPNCGAAKARPRPFIEGAAWCSGCGWMGRLDELDEGTPAR